MSSRASRTSSQLGLEMPEAVRECIAKTVYGRTLLRLYEAACRAPRMHPSRGTWAKYLRILARENPRLSFLIGEMRAPDHNWSGVYDDLAAVPDNERLLVDLESLPEFGSRVLSICGCPEGLPSDIGVLAVEETLDVGGRLVTAFSFDDHFPGLMGAPVEIRATRNNPEPAFVVLARSPMTFARDADDLPAYVSFILRALATMTAAPPRLRFVSPDEAAGLQLDLSDGPAVDATLDKLLAAVLRGQGAATSADVPLSLIELSDPGFAMKESIDVEEIIVDAIQGQEQPLLLYWNGRRYVLSDDHATYMAYRHLRRTDVPAVILGELGPVSRIRERGGASLLPAVGLLTGFPEPTLAEWNRKVRANRDDDISTGYARLHAVFMRFAGLLASRSTKERPLQEIIKSQIASIDAYGTGLKSEVRLGKEYRIDFVISHRGSDARTVLVELERASHPIFTRSGRFRQPVVHAMHQIEDWFRWCSEHPGQVPDCIRADEPLEGLVVIGRSRDLDDGSRRRLVHLNREKRIRVITYDDLLDRIELLMDSM